MEENQKIIMQWILFWVFIFVLLSSVMCVLFDVGNLSENNKSLLLKGVIVENGVALIPILYFIFGLKKTKPEKERKIVRTNSVLKKELSQSDNTNEKTYNSIILVDRKQVDIEIGTVEERLGNAREEVLISGNDCKFIAESISPFIEQTLKRDIKVKILCVEPNSSVVEMLVKIDPRFSSEKSFNDSMQSVERKLFDFKERYPLYFGFRYLPILPAMGFFITDPNNLNGIVKVEIYTAKKWTPIDSRPHIILPTESKMWRGYFISQWNNYWDLAKEPI